MAIDLKLFEPWVKNTLMETLDIKITHAAEGELDATMPVSPKNHQPYGLLHGGATAALAETIGSFGSVLLVDREKYAVVGIKLDCSHIRSTKSGIVTGKGKIIHQGRSTHLWEINVYDDQDRLLSSCRLTNFIKAL